MSEWTPDDGENFADAAGGGLGLIEPTRENPTLIEGVPMFAGCRVRLVSMGDDPCPINAGSIGTIGFIESESLMQSRVYGDEQTAPTVHVKWDDGRSLGLLPGVDKFVRILRCDWHGCNRDFEYREETGRKVDGTEVKRPAGFCSPECGRAWLADDKRDEMRMDAMNDDYDRED